MAGIITTMATRPYFMKRHSTRTHGNLSATQKIYVKNIADAFCKADTEGCDAYKSNATAYRAELTKLDDEVRRAVAAIPRDRRVVVVGHNAFRYFENAYGITFLSPKAYLRNLKPRRQMWLALFVRSRENGQQRFLPKISLTQDWLNR